MISDFIYLEKIEDSIYEATYKCSLPDPDPYSDEIMIECGTVSVVESFENFKCTLSVNLFDNFKDLCIGDVYQRKHFVTTIIQIIENNSDFDLSDALIILNDFRGVYNGLVEDLDEGNYG